MDTIHEGGVDNSVSSHPQLENELLSPFRQELPIPKVSLWQQLSTYLSGAALILLLACYAAIMLSLIWFSADYLISHAKLLMAGESVFWYLVLGTLVLAVAFLLVKPALHIRVRGLTPLAVNRQEQPLLYKYVDELCKKLDAPTPSRISLEIGPNAAAGIKKLFSFGKKVELDMTLGLTLMAALDVRQFTAIVAHELGHFARHGNMRLGGIIRSINIWFARAIYEPDRFDEWLFITMRHHPFLSPLFILPRFVMRLGRRLLWLFMTLGGVASCMIARQDEYHSDTYSARLSGGEASTHALRQGMVLGLAMDAAMADIRESWQEKRLPDDMPRMIVAKAGRLSPDGRRSVLDMLQSQRTQWLDVHPCLQDRIHAMQSIKAQGIISCDRPARILLNNFFQMCHGSSLELYRHLLKDDFDKTMIVPAEMLIKEHAAQEESSKALERFYQGGVPTMRPIFPVEESLTPPDDFEQAKAQCIAHREEMINSLKGLQLAWRKLIERHERHYILIEILSAVDAGFSVAPRPQLGLSDISRQNIINQLQKTQRELDAVGEELSPLEETVRLRMTSGLRLLHTEAVPGTADLSREQLRAVVKASAVLDRNDKLFSELSRHARLLVTMLQIPRHRSLSPRAYDATVDACRIRLHGLLKELSGALSEAAYPYEHFRKGATLADYIIEKPLQSANDPQLAMTAIDCLSRLDTLTLRIMAQLAKTTEEAEKAIGLASQEPPRYEEPLPIDVRPKQSSSSGAMAVAQMGLAAAVILLSVGFAAAFKSASPKFAVLPKHDDYRPTIISASWTPPPRADVWNMGMQPYQPGAFAPNQSLPNSPNTTVRTDPWGRPPDWKTRNDLPGNQGYRYNQPANQPTNQPGYQPPNQPGPGHNPNNRPSYQPARPGVQPGPPSPPSGGRPSGGPGGRR